MAFPDTEKDSEIFHMDSRWMITELLKTHSSQLSDSAIATVALGCVCSFLHLFWLHWSSCNAWASLVAACGFSCSMGFLGGKESTCQCRRHRFDTWVREDPLEEDMAIHTSILAWRISSQRTLTGYSPQGHKELAKTKWLSFTHTWDPWAGIEPALPALVGRFITAGPPQKSLCLQL